MLFRKRQCTSVVKLLMYFQSQHTNYGIVLSVSAMCCLTRRSVRFIISIHTTYIFTLQRNPNVTDLLQLSIYSHYIGILM